jgi:hypothetical protein
MGLIMIVGVVVAIAAAARSTWSPCGLSMLSTITPLSEAGRGHRYSATAAWFVLGALAGGVMLGGAAALGAAGVAAAGPSLAVTAGVAAAAALVAAAGDAGMTAVRFPLFRRQVNERWLDQYRAWFYGAGFGWQVGVGVATYIMTAGVFLTVTLAVLTARPGAALLIGTVFGGARGLTVLLTRRLRSPEALRSFHRRFGRLESPVRIGTIAVEVGAAAVLAAAVWAPAAVIVAGMAAASVTVRHVRDRSAGATMAGSTAR